jgi:hypothetical protein
MLLIPAKWKPLESGEETMNLIRTFGQSWPRWLRTLVILFFLLLVASLLLWVMFYFQSLSMSAVPPLINPEVGKDWAGTASAFAGLGVTLLTGYGLFIDNRKKQVELEIEKLKLEQHRQEFEKSKARKAPAKKKKPAK